MITRLLTASLLTAIVFCELQPQQSLTHFGSQAWADESLPPYSPANRPQFSLSNSLIFVGANLQDLESDLVHPQTPSLSPTADFDRTGNNSFYAGSLYFVIGSQLAVSEDLTAKKLLNILEPKLVLDKYQFFALEPETVTPFEILTLARVNVLSRAPTALTPHPVKEFVVALKMNGLDELQRTQMRQLAREKFDPSSDSIKLKMPLRDIRVLREKNNSRPLVYLSFQQRADLDLVRGSLRNIPFKLTLSFSDAEGKPLASWSFDESEAREELQNLSTVSYIQGSKIRSFCMNSLLGRSEF